ncbi:MAG: MEDS domain-containing protein [Mycobacteriales bacterium]
MSALTPVAQHAVTFYTEPMALDAAVAAFLGPALQLHAPVLVIATPAHLSSIEQALARSGTDVCGAAHYRALDARDTVESFLVAGMPDPGLFADTVEVAVHEQVGRGVGPLHAYGEMVALLWEDGNVAGALALEALWNDLIARQPLALLCGYPQTSMEGAAQICAHHDHVVDPGLMLRREFGPEPASVPEARRFLTTALRGWGMLAIMDAAEVVLSELAGNAVRHGGGGYSVEVERESGGLRLRVHDPVEALPHLIRDVPVGATGGRGLMLVEALSDAWGIDRRDTGKTVWAYLAT